MVSNCTCASAACSSAGSVVRSAWRKRLERRHAARGTAVRRRRHEGRVAGAAAADPVLRAAELAGRGLIPAHALHQPSRAAHARGADTSAVSSSAAHRIRARPRSCRPRAGPPPTPHGSCRRRPRRGAARPSSPACLRYRLDSTASRRTNGAISRWGFGSSRVTPASSPSRRLASATGPPSAQSSSSDGGSGFGRRPSIRSRSGRRGQGCLRRSRQGASMDASRTTSFATATPIIPWRHKVS